MKWRVMAGFALVGAILMYFPELRAQLNYPRFLLTFLYFVFFWIAFATSWNILTGYSGYFSFGHSALYGAGVYTTAVLVERQGWPFLMTLPLAGVVAALLGLLIGFVAFRLRRVRGEMFALLTLAVDFVLASVVRNVDYVDGGIGRSMMGAQYPQFLGGFTEMMYRLGLVLALLTVFTAYVVQHSRLGRGLFAINDDEAVAEGLGVPTFRYKMMAFGLSAFFAGLAGGLHTAQISYITVEGTFNLTSAVFVILMSVLGGRQNWLGPAIGAIIIYTFNDAFSDTRFQFLNEVVIGGLLIVIILFVPEGIFKRLRRRIVPATMVAAAVIIIQVIAIRGRITELAAVVITSVLALLLIPEPFYARIVGRFFTRTRAVTGGIEVAAAPGSKD
jgi:branched-chain amino acid transport system permease protein